MPKDTPEIKTKRLKDQTVPLKSFWEEEEAGAEWVNFSDAVPIDVIIEESEPTQVEIPFLYLGIRESILYPHLVPVLRTKWGTATVLIVWEFSKDSLTGGIQKRLRINSKRLRRGLKNASPGGIPARGNGYRIIRTGESWSTTYNVAYTGKWKVLPGGARKAIPHTE